VALSIKLIVTMELFLNRSVQNLHLAVFRTEKISIALGLQDAGFERIRILRFLNAKSWLKYPDIGRYACSERVRFLSPIE
jgi:hypothetical protein